MIKYFFEGYISTEQLQISMQNARKSYLATEVLVHQNKYSFNYFVSTDVRYNSRVEKMQRLKPRNYALEL
jgi:hypothetical protein